MATYKLIQDVEAEDHILGPLSLRQFIFALMGAFFFYLSFLVVSRHFTFLLVLFLPPGLFFAFFAIPFDRDQPTEVWLLAKFRFWFKPRKRVWDQSGVKELVTITVPKKIEKVLTNGLSQYEVQSRLNALANTLDSRGWVVKNANLGMATPYVFGGAANDDSDRLVAVSDAPEVPEEAIPAGADILDEDTSLISQQFEQMITKSSQDHRQQLIDRMNAPLPEPVQPTPAASSNNQWFMPAVDNTPQPVTAPIVAAQDETSEEAELAAKLKAHHTELQKTYHSNLRTIQPLGSQPQTAAAPIASIAAQQASQSQASAQTDATSTQQPEPVAQPSDAALTQQPNPAILNLANNNDLNVDTIAREAKRAQEEELGRDEVVISLH